MVTVITGASGGIGAALALRLGREGHRLVLAARRADRLTEVARQAEAAGSPGAAAVTADVTQRDQVESLGEEALARFGRFDVWVNNAGRGITRSVLDLSDADLDDMITVNLKSALYGMQAAVPHFLDRGTGHLINVSSFLGRVPLASYRSAYNAAKAGLNALTANLRMDLRVRAPDVHVSLVMPGLVSTDFARNAVDAFDEPPVAGLRSSSAAGVAQTADEVAEMIAELIAHPRPEIYTNPAGPGQAKRYFADVEAFEEQLAQRHA
jgi:short-subunit dehydrogenase